jgi:hypothetical protein
MFDSHHLHVRNVSESVTRRVEITENRAPTDESVRLLREMEDRAQARIVATTRVEDMGISCVIHKMAEPHTGDTKYAVIYSLNGKKYRADYTAEWSCKTKDEQARARVIGLRDALAADIATHLLVDAFKILPNEF